MYASSIYITALLFICKAGDTRASKITNLGLKKKFILIPSIIGLIKQNFHIHNVNVSLSRLLTLTEKNFYGGI